MFSTQLTEADPEWTTRFGNVGGSGEYTSGFSAFSTASAAVLENFYCEDQLAFCFETDNSIGPRCYDSVVEGAIEAGRSRVYQGVHFEFTVDMSRPVGFSVGDEVASNALHAVNGEAAWECE